MKFFRRKTRDDRSVDTDHDDPQAKMIDLTAIDDFSLDEVSAVLSEHDADIDRLADRIESLRQDGERLCEFDPAEAIDRRGSVKTLDLREMMVSSDVEDDGVDRWFDAAFAEGAGDDVARNWLEQG